jgi:hypothetical protein
MKKTTARKQTRSTRTPAPAGLVAAFKLIQMDGFSACAPRLLACEMQPHAINIIAHLNGGIDPKGHNNDVLIQDELTAAVQTMNPGPRPDHEPDPAESPELMSFAGFHVGFAVCWLLMTAINGNGGTVPARPFERRNGRGQR